MDPSARPRAVDSTPRFSGHNPARIRRPLIRPVPARAWAGVGPVRARDERLRGPGRRTGPRKLSNYIGCSNRRIAMGRSDVHAWLTAYDRKQQAHKEGRAALAWL